jgi:AraC-like DNA-binding protein/uncharacterized RmlC-like cupin family protein
MIAVREDHAFMRRRKATSSIGPDAAPFQARLLTIHLFKADSARRRVTHRGADPREEPCEIVVMLSGIYRAFLGGRRDEPIEAGPGDVLWWPMGVERIEENDPARPTQCMAIYFDWPAAPVGLPYLVRDRSGTIRLLAERLLSLRDYPLPLPPAVGHSYLAAILAEFVRQAGLAEDSLVARVARYIEEHMFESFTLKELAAHVGLERHHFGRKYAALTGQPPMRHVRQRRAEHALSMILSMPNLNLKDAVGGCGARDAYQLRRLLKTHFGIPIRDLRKLSKAVGSTHPPSPGARGRGTLSPVLASLLGRLAHVR